VDSGIMGLHLQGSVRVHKTKPYTFAFALSTTMIMFKIYCNPGQLLTIWHVQKTANATGIL